MTKYIVDVFGDRTEWRNEDCELHRLDGPAIEWKTGLKFWFSNDMLHRTDGPAIEWVNGTKEWYINGNRHRLDGPAVEMSNGTKMWYVDGKRHRSDGPAVLRADGSRLWYIRGEKLTKSEFNKRTKSNREGRVFEVGGVKYKLITI